MHFDGRYMSFLQGIFWNRKKEKPLQSLPSRSITDAFTEYINNEIPSCFIDTSKLQFVSRKDVLRIFQDEIANITEEKIQERISNSQSGPLASYEPGRETVLRQIIQEVVKYDTLSHHRDEIAGEPTYRDIYARKWYTSTHKFKSSKVVRFCKMSRRLGCKLAWVDTCCVDQSNAAEFSEATQAMFKWYANSYLCIVYLAESTSYEDWVRESWFTESWTLLDLLASRRIKFYNKNWQPFDPLNDGDDRKHVDIVRRLENATGVSNAVLTADNTQGIHGRTFWEIMSWVLKRKMIHIDDNMIYYLARSFHVNLPTTYGQQNFLRLVETIVAKNPSWDVFAWFGQPSANHFALPSSPESYPKFEACMVEGRGGAQEFKVTPNELSLRSLPPIPMELCSVIVPDEPGHPFHVNLKPRSYKESLWGRYGDLVVECGAGRLEIIRGARQLAACIINHHATQSRQQGKLVVGANYICFLLYSENGDDESSWMKLITDNLLRISCVGMPDTTSSDMVNQEPGVKDSMQPGGVAGRKAFTLPLVTTSVRSPTSK